MYNLCCGIGLICFQIIFHTVIRCDVVVDPYRSSVDSAPSWTSRIGRLRRDDLPTIRLETVIILDEDYILYLQSIGHTTEEKMTEIIQLKMNAAQSEFGKADVFGYHIFIDVKRIDFWYINPDWYSPSADLDVLLYRVCFGAEEQGLYTTFDVIHLFTGVDNPDVSGKAYTGKACDPKRKCAVSTKTRVTEYVIPTHELGHSLGMSHDVDVGCPSPEDGIMGSKTSGWSTCSVNSTQELLRGSTVGCLFETNVFADTVLTLTSEWPGMAYTDDEICELHHGPGYVYRPFPYTAWGECALHSCWNMSTSAVQSGRTYNHYFPTDGRYCGPGQVCSSQAVSGSYRCIPWEETGLQDSLFAVVQGGWSSWGEWSSCGRSCGTGVRYRQRACDNPRPKNSPSCNGSRYDAVLCNKQPCESDEPDERLLIRQRAGEVCAILQLDGYLTTGDRYHYQYDAQCEVRCDTAAGHTAPAYQRYGMIPDGTPCSSQSETFVEKYNLPRQPGYTHNCVQGYCLRFDCEGTTSGEVTNDNCGVCGGADTTCEYSQAIYNTTLTNYRTETITELPPGAFLIQFYFVFDEMDTYLMELWSEDNEVVISPFDNGIYTTEEVPVAFAGVSWHYDFAIQYLFADGPINSSAIVKVIGYENNENKGIHYSYSIPKDMGVGVGENCSGTFCSDTEAYCDNENLCTCKQGFQYNTTFCTDIDECSGPDHGCYDVTSGGECNNTIGSFICRCKNGFIGDGITDCQDIDECLGPDHGCYDVTSGGECSNTIGSFICRCQDGFTGDGITECQDIDECSGPDHGCYDVTSGGECSNTVGSFICRCQDGFTGDGITDCQDIDECSGPGHGCYDVTSGGECSNTVGSFICRCQDGFTGDGITDCQDIDECSGPDHGCYDVTSGGECSNTIGSFICRCKNGFTGDGITDCQDIDECSGPDHGCFDVTSGGECSNTIGSFICRCKEGFTEDGITECQDIDECSGPDHGCYDVTSGGECSNTIGSFICRCQDGFTGDGITECQDIDECSHDDMNECVSTDNGGQCTNLVGSYQCGCTDGNTGNGTTLCVSPLMDEDLDDVVYTIFTATYVVMILAVFIHSAVYLLVDVRGRNERRRRNERVFSSLSVATSGLILLGEAIFLIGINKQLTGADCGPLSVFIQISCIGTFTMIWIDVFTAYVLTRPEDNRLCVTWTGLLISIGLTSVAITVLAVVTDLEGFVLPEGCWYDIHHTVFTATWPIVGIAIAMTCIFGIAVHFKLSADIRRHSGRKDPSYEIPTAHASTKEMRFLRSIVRRNLWCAPCHGAAWVLRVVSVNYQTVWVPIALVVLNIEGLVFLFSRLYIFNYKWCRTAKSNPRTRDIDHPDHPNLPNKEDVRGSPVTHEAGDKINYTDIHISLEGRPHSIYGHNSTDL